MAPENGSSRVLTTILFMLSLTAASLVLPPSTLSDDASGAPEAPPEDGVQEREAHAEPATRATYGTLDWKYDTTGAQAISTPALADLNGDGTLEVVFATTANSVYALSSTGSKMWLPSWSGNSRANMPSTTPMMM